MAAADHLQGQLFDPGPDTRETLNYEVNPREGVLLDAPSKADHWADGVNPEHVKPRLFYAPDQYRNMVTDSVDRIGPHTTWVPTYRTDRNAGTQYDTEGNTVNPRVRTYRSVEHPGETMEDLWREKLYEATQSRSTDVHGSGIHESVGKHGVKHPPVVDMKVTMRAGYVGQDDPGQITRTNAVHGEGHHRAVSAMDHGHWLYPKFNFKDAYGSQGLPADRPKREFDTGKRLWPTQEAAIARGELDEEEARRENRGIWG